MTKAKQGDRVEVEWEDASSVSPWMSLEDANEFHLSPPVMSSCGYFLKHDKMALTMVTTVAPDGTMAGVWRIPNGMVKSVTVIKRNKS